MTRLPFEIPDNRGHTVTGLLYLEDAFVVFEVQVKKWGLFEQPVRTVKVEYGVITSITHERGFLNDHLFIVPKRSDLLTAIPGTHKGELKLKIAKRYRDQAQMLVTELRARRPA